MTNKNVGI